MTICITGNRKGSQPEGVNVFVTQTKSDTKFTETTNCTSGDSCCRLIGESKEENEFFKCFLLPCSSSSLFYTSSNLKRLILEGSSRWPMMAGQRKHAVKNTWSVFLCVYKDRFGLQTPSPSLAKPAVCLCCLFFSPSTSFFLSFMFNFKPPSSNTRISGVFGRIGWLGAPLAVVSDR